ncbi:MAG: LemA family protein [Elusimicrobia bacterium]|nr:LemA family protein [Elusimicrobiota bacterium]
MVLLIVLVVVGLVVMGMYNGLIAKKNQVENAFASIDTMLKKRYDLIPNLVASVQQYMQHEQKTLVGLTEMRARAVSGGLSPQETAELDQKITKTLGGIMVAVENYPDLKANQNFLQLQAALNETEEQISAARRAYNASVVDYNNAIEMFPTSIMAGMMNYQRKVVFTAAEAERGNVNVKELFKK